MWQDAAVELELPIKNPITGKPNWISILDNEILSETIWENFIPVVISEDNYADMFAEVKLKRNMRYKERFNDDSVKIMDAAGTILNSRLSFEGSWESYFKLLFERYSINTFYIADELRNYNSEPNFTNTFRLASKYMEFVHLNTKKLERELLDVALIYLEEAKSKAVVTKDFSLVQKCDLLEELYTYAIKNRPKKIIKELERVRESGLFPTNENLFASLSFVANSLLGDKAEASVWKTKVSSVTLKKLELLLNKQ